MASIFTFRQLLEVTPTVIELLTSAESHRGGRINVSAIDCADREISVLAWLSGRYNIDLSGFPAWRRPDGKIRGLSPRTPPRRIIWLCDDLKDIPVTDAEFEALWLARQKSIVCHKGVRGVMADLREKSITPAQRRVELSGGREDLFAAFKIGKHA